MKNEIIENKTELVIYESQDGNVKLDVNLENETVWLSLDQMTKLFGRDKSVISRHIKNIFSEEELKRDEVVAKFATTTKHGAIDGKTQTHLVDYYNLDVVSGKYFYELLNRIKDIRSSEKVLYRQVLDLYATENP